MKVTAGRSVALVLCVACASVLLHAQGRGGQEWTTAGYDAQRTSSIRTDPRLSVQTMTKPGEFGAFKLLWKIKLEHDPKAATALTPPILLDRIIGFRGFKSIAFVGTQSETVHAIDVDLGTPLWKYHINYSASPPPVLNTTADCPGGLTAALARPTNIAPPLPGAFAGGGGGRGGRSGGGVGEPGMGAATLATAGQPRGGGPGQGGRGRAGAPPGAVPGSAAAAAGNVPGGPPPAARGGGGFGGGGFVPGGDAAYVVGSDGFLHALNVQNGMDVMTPASFVPPNTRARGLLIATQAEGRPVAYAATTRGCGSQPDAVWALELGPEKKPVVAFQLKGATIAGSAGVSVGRDGTVYVATAAGTGAQANSLFALEPATLKLKASAAVASAGFTTSPIVFQWTSKDVVAAAGKGTLYLFDGSALSDGPIATVALPASDKFERGALSSWIDAQNVRWIAVPSSRGIVAFKVTETGGKAALQSGWTSRDIPSPLAPLVVNGVLFAASAGTKLAPSVLYAIDASNGKDLWNSARAITTTVTSGLSAGPGNIYVPGADGTLYAFGFAIEK